jgi:hypothetical protein
VAQGAGVGTPQAGIGRSSKDQQAPEGVTGMKRGRRLKQTKALISARKTGLKFKNSAAFMRMADYYGMDGAFKYARLFAERSTALTNYRLCKARSNEYA